MLRTGRLGIPSVPGRIWLVCVCVKERQGKTIENRTGQHWNSMFFEIHRINMVLVEHGLNVVNAAAYSARTRSRTTPLPPVSRRPAGRHPF